MSVYIGDFLGGLGLRNLGVVIRLQSLAGSFSCSKRTVKLNPTPEASNLRLWDSGLRLTNYGLGLMTVETGFLVGPQTVSFLRCWHVGRPTSM